MNFILTSRNIKKSFGSTHALRDVSLNISKGERIAILGANGAGKSTLMKVFSGVVQADSGSMELNQQSYSPKTPYEAISQGVSTVYQEPFFFPHLSVLENLLLGKGMPSKKGLLNSKDLIDKASELISKVALESKILVKKMGSLSLAEQQLILIARSVEQNTTLLILDEPTSILTGTESARLFNIVNKLALSGTSVCYITHRFDELEKVANRFIVMRDGEISGDINEANRDKILDMMGTKESFDISNASSSTPKPKKPINKNGAKILSISNLTSNGKFEDISFDVKLGQVVGIYGLIGSGRTEIAKSIFGELPINAGTIKYKEKMFTPKSGKNCIENGITYLPEDRKTQGIFQFLSIRKNISISILSKISSFGVIKSYFEKKISQDAIVKYSIKTNDVENIITSLSGGNQQKTLFSRLLTSKPDLLILDEPTRGIDVKTKFEIHDKILEIAADNTAILLITSELPELLYLSDEVHILRQGKIVSSFSKEDLNEKDILSSATGILA